MSNPNRAVSLGRILRGAVLAGLCLAGGATCGTLGGCYTRVVKAQGVGDATYKVEPVYRSETAADRLFDRATGTSKPAGSGPIR